jgi:hypothetical protein
MLFHYQSGFFCYLNRSIRNISSNLTNPVVRGRVTESLLVVLPVSIKIGRFILSFLDDLQKLSNFISLGDESMPTKLRTNFIDMRQGQKWKLMYSGRPVNFFSLPDRSVFNSFFFFLFYMNSNEWLKVNLIWLLHVKKVRTCQKEIRNMKSLPTDSPSKMWARFFNYVV